MIDASDLYGLAHDLGETGRRTSSVMFDVYRETGTELRDQWRSNARETSGTHGRLYPDSITLDMRIRLGIEAEVGPDPSKPQGGMGPGFEFGSVNQDPHLDGQRAADVVVPRLRRRVDAGLSDLGL